MDIYGFLDIVAVVIGLIVAAKLRTKESILLAGFFICTSLSSFVLFQTDFYKFFDIAFILFSVIFGLSSNKHPVVLGYFAYVFLVCLNATYEVIFYSFYIYIIYAYQLWVVRYEALRSCIGPIWLNHFDKAHYKDIKEKTV